MRAGRTRAGRKRTAGRRVSEHCSFVAPALPAPLFLTNTNTTPVALLASVAPTSPPRKKVKVAAVKVTSPTRAGKAAAAAAESECPLSAVLCVMFSVSLTKTPALALPQSGRPPP